MSRKKVSLVRKKLGLIAGVMMLGSMVFVGTAQAAPAVDTCNDPNTGFYCLYRDANYGGGAPQIYGSCGEYPLNNRDVVSSWKSRQYGGAWVEVWNYPPSTPGYLWSMPQGAQSSYVGDNLNDKADYVINHC